MKKVFITGVAEQTGRFDNPIYLATQADLENNQNEHYPIFNVMENAIKEGDDVELVAIKFPNESLERNFFILNDRVKRFEQEHSIEIKTIPIDHKGETKKAHTELFLELIEKIDDSCEIYADITYGTKPTPMIIFAL
ncbi:MAG: TM1812 family CRISPR-associated protein, partial [Oscillospiraceae bacterium]|nr:TM1812 family CRISPR-associated protein [Oscillospiraceae bacterium]